MIIDSHCTRCLAPAPNVDDPAFMEWEALDANPRIALRRNAR